MQIPLILSTTVYNITRKVYAMGVEELERPN